MAGREHTTCATHQHDANGLVRQGQIERRVDLVQHPVALGVPVGGSIERDHTNTGFNRVYNLLKRHADPSRLIA